MEKTSNIILIYITNLDSNLLDFDAKVTTYEYLVYFIISTILNSRKSNAILVLL